MRSTPLLLCLTACTVGESSFVSGTDGIEVERKDDRTTIRLSEDTDQPGGLADQVGRNATLQEQVATRIIQPVAISLSEDPRLADAVAGSVSQRTSFQAQVASQTAGPVAQTLKADADFLRDARGEKGDRGEPGPGGADPRFDGLSGQMDDLLTALAELREATYCPRLVTYEGSTPRDQLSLGAATPGLRVYAREPSSPPNVVRCRFDVGGGVFDEMVKVGSFWIDRYEGAVEQGSGITGTGPAHNTTARAISRRGTQPAALLTFFQAAALCANAGKRLCSNGEWQSAAAGTHDPGAHPGSASQPSPDGSCNTLSSGLRLTGRAGTDPQGTHACISKFGAEDMIGNLWEWVDLWNQAGRPQSSAQGQSRAPWPTGYGEDHTLGVDGEAASGAAGYVPGAPAAAVRGDSWQNGTDAGAFSMALVNAPSHTGVLMGFRCCAGGQ